MEKRPGRKEALEILEELRDMGVSDTKILEYILENHLNSDMAWQVMSDFLKFEVGE